MLLNCDIGERGIEHTDDLKLLEYIDIANIACGGHAGNKQSARSFYARAKEFGVIPTLHLSYPDVENFGRLSLDIPASDLLKSLSSQRSVLPEVTIAKFHGALYHDCAYRKDLAERTVDWLAEHGIEQLLAPPDSWISRLALASAISVYAEGFIDRRYVTREHTSKLSLMDRKEPGACINTIQEAIAQSENIITRNAVEARIIDRDGRLTNRTESVSLKVETLCIHSDSSIALPLAKAFANFKQSLAR
jgi:UPF0271 protein